jgi:hypothetical protein
LATVRSADHAWMREINIALIAECLRRRAPLSRAELAHMTGLTKSTVSSLVKELVEARLVRETSTDPGHKGRPAIPLVLNPDAGFMIGVEIGVGFISLLLTNFAASVVWRQHEAARATGPNETLMRVAALIALAMRQAALRGGGVLGVGLGVPGLVDVEQGWLLYAPNLGWSNVPLRRLLEAELQLPVYVDNEANLAALGESYFGAGRSSDFVLYVSSAWAAASCSTGASWPAWPAWRAKSGIW